MARVPISKSSFNPGASLQLVLGPGALMFSKDKEGSSLLSVQQGLQESSPAREALKEGHKRKGHGKHKARDFLAAATEHHENQELRSGGICLDCGRGKLYKFQPSEFARIKGQAPLQATVHIIDQLRCNHCQKVYKAELPPEVVADGALRQRVGYFAVAMVALLKYVAGSPFGASEKLKFAPRRHFRR